MRILIGRDCRRWLENGKIIVRISWQNWTHVIMATDCLFWAIRSHVQTTLRHYLMIHSPSDTINESSAQHLCQNKFKVLKNSQLIMKNHDIPPVCLSRSVHIRSSSCLWSDWPTLLIQLDLSHWVDNIYVVVNLLVPETMKITKQNLPNKVERIYQTCQHLLRDKWGWMLINFKWRLTDRVARQEGCLNYGPQAATSSPVLDLAIFFCFLFKVK